MNFIFYEEFYLMILFLRALLSWSLAKEIFKKRMQKRKKESGHKISHLKIKIDVFSKTCFSKCLLWVDLHKSMNNNYFGDDHKNMGLCPCLLKCFDWLKANANVHMKRELVNIIQYIRLSQNQSSSDVTRQIYLWLMFHRFLKRLIW